MCANLERRADLGVCLQASAVPSQVPFPVPARVSQPQLSMGPHTSQQLFHVFFPHQLNQMQQMGVHSTQTRGQMPQHSQQALWSLQQSQQLPQHVQPPHAHLPQLQQQAGLPYLPYGQLQASLIPPVLQQARSAATATAPCTASTATAVPAASHGPTPWSEACDVPSASARTLMASCPSKIPRNSCSRRHTQRHA